MGRNSTIVIKDFMVQGTAIPTRKAASTPREPVGTGGRATRSTARRAGIEQAPGWRALSAISSAGKNTGGSGFHQEVLSEQNTKHLNECTTVGKVVEGLDVIPEILEWHCVSKARVSSDSGNSKVSGPRRRPIYSAADGLILGAVSLFLLLTAIVVMTKMRIITGGSGGGNAHQWDPHLVIDSSSLLLSWLVHSYYCF